jgi:hypothetical protein
MGYDEEMLRTMAESKAKQLTQGSGAKIDFSNWFKSLFSKK